MARRREIKADQVRKIRKIENKLELQVQFENFIEHCLERNLKPSTISSYTTYVNYLKNYLNRKEHDLYVNNIKEENIKSFIKFLREVKQVKQETINSSIGNLKPFFIFLKNEGIILENPMENIKKGKVDRKPIISFSHEELKRVLKQPDKSTYVGYRDFCMMLLLADTGMRITEALEVQIGWIDFKQSRIVLVSTKNRHSRVVGISNKVKTELKNYIKLCLSDCKEDDVLFQNIYGERLKLRSVQDNFKQYGDSIGVKVTPKLFRKYFAINYLKNGGSTSGLREILGHLTMETVERYVYWAQDDIVEQNNKYTPINNLFENE